MRNYVFFAFVLLLVFTSWSAHAVKIVMISAADPPAGADVMVIERLEGLGFEVESHSQNEQDPVDLTGVDAVVIGEALGSGNVTDGYKDVSIPVITIEAFVLDNMALATDGTFNQDQDNMLNIVDAHPIAGNLSGTVEIASAIADICSVGEVLGDVQIIAEIAANGHTALAIWEAGSNDADGNPIPARRAFAFLHANLTPLLNDDGWGLFDRSVLWALDQLTPVNPEGSLPTTWGTIKTQYR